MSLAVLTQVYAEARRLAVAGSAVAAGDFRLKKLLPALDQAGAKAPVFAKIADAARAVIDGPESTSAETLLELTTLVTAVLYTQGETGLAGPLEPIPTVAFDGTTQTPARVLKPLLEALTRTGSGRLEVIRDAHAQGVFRDLRLFTPALAGIDDTYGEIADFLTEQVLPTYGTAILPALRASYDPTGARGHARRLRLMHALDPAATRDLIVEALEKGSKEVRVEAIGCLSAEDLPTLIEQVGAKAGDVRAAAYRALSRLADPTAHAIIFKGLTGKDAHAVANAIFQTTTPALVPTLIEAVATAVAALATLDDQKKVGDRINVLRVLLGSFPVGDDAAVEQMLLDLFARRAEFAKVKGEPASGNDLNEAIVWRMAERSAKTQATLAEVHGQLDGGSFAFAFAAARRVWTPAKVFDQFAPYLTTDAKRKGKDSGRTKALIDALGGHHIYYHSFRQSPGAPLDPRWLDEAVRLKNLALVISVGRPGHPAAEAFLLATYNAAQKAAKLDDLRDVVIAMVRLQHPAATDAFLAAYSAAASTPRAYTYWYLQLIRDLPVTAIPRLEALVATVPPTEADGLLHAIQSLREKSTDAPASTA